MQCRILLVEDEQAITDMVDYALSRSGFEVTAAADAEAARLALHQRLPDLVLVDWMLPGLSGLDLVRRIRRDEVTQNLPVIMLTARSEEEDKVQGLEAGADDFVTKPFSPRELIARIRAVLRRTGEEDGEGRLVFGDLVLDITAHRVTVAEEPVTLGPTEFRLLRFLMAHPERVYSRAQLLDNVWGRDAYVEERTVDVHVLRLRKALRPSGMGEVIQTVRGAGYRFSPEMAPAPGAAGVSKAGGARADGGRTE